ncbi:2-carboxy-1,4-naphthoquinone phytyltransferase, chloroplastic isoform X3 [Typha latifolia]|uniref:2-carboxy-1,4-naphthoquinone phytyltransferase, chloroplastic isoform X3 n=1 Tax=Typha latifolia TaxID=4733 RepID=UPI003C2DB6E3
MAFFAIPLCPPPPLLSRRISSPSPLLSRRISSPSSLRRILVRNPRFPLLPRSSSEPATKGFDAVGEGGGDKISRATLLWRAAKLPIYSVALVPLTVGSAAAYLHTGLFFAKRYLVLLTASVLVITWLNLRDNEICFTYMSRSRRVTQFAASISLFLGFMGLVWSFAEAGDIRFLLLILHAILCGYVYQCPPFRLSYQGLGEPLCFAAFGPFATTAFYFSNSSKNSLSGTGLLPLTGTVLTASFLVGLTTTLILFCSHFHQIDGDLAVGKISPLVRIGTEAGSSVVKLGVVSLYVLLLVFGLSKALPTTCVFLCALTLPVGALVTNFVDKNYNDNIKIFMAKYYCVRLHALFGTALAFGLFIARNRTIP